MSSPLVSEGLIAHWRFDEGVGTETYDSTGFSTAAQVFDGASWTDGRGGQFGKALDFNGGNLAYVQVGSFQIGGAMSFSGWTYKRNLGNWQRMVDFGNGTNDNLLLANRWSTNQLEWGIRRGGDNRALVVQDFWMLNEWQHAVATVDDSSVMKVYRNGQLMGSMIGHLPRTRSRVNQFVGRSNWNDAYFDGMMDDLRVYDRAVSQNEVGQIYAGDLEQTVTLGGEDPTITLFWGDEDPGQTTSVNGASPDAWDASNLLGVKPLGEFSFDLSGLQVGKTYYFRLLATNAAGSSWSSGATEFSTGSFGFTANSFADGNLLLWLDGSDVNGDGNLSNEPLGGTLDQWRDKSGASRHAGNGQGPDVRVSRWNGHSTVKFDGQTQYLRVADSPAFDFGEDATIFVVAKGDTLSDWRPIISKRGEDNVGWQFRKDNTDFATFTVRGTTGNDGQRGGTPINGEAHAWSMRKTALKRTQWADGNEEYEIDDRDTVPSTTSDLVIGARDQNGITAYGGVEIGEILVFDSALSNEQVSSLQGHLAHKWGLTDGMSDAHPYKTEPPLFENRPEITLASSYTFFFQSGTPVNLQITTNRPADAYSASGLPPGLDVNSSTGLISGIPTSTGAFTATLQTSNAAGSFSKQVVLDIRDFSAWKFSSEITFPGYSGASRITDFQVYVELNNSLSGFNYEQFASPSATTCGSSQTKATRNWNTRSCSGIRPSLLLLGQPSRPRRFGVHQGPLG